jgi:nucleoid DNA-binding protein
LAQSQKTLVLQRFMFYTFTCGFGQRCFRKFRKPLARVCSGFQLKFLGKVENNMATKKAAKKAPKKAAKKAPAKKKAAKKAAPVKKSATPITQKMTKSHIVAHLAEAAALTKKEVSTVIDEIGALIERSIKKRAVGEFTLPGILKITTVAKPAKKARKGINPFTGEEQMFKAKPASIGVKVRPLKKLKESAAS